MKFKLKITKKSLWKKEIKETPIVIGLYEQLKSSNVHVYNKGELSVSRLQEVFDSLYKN